MDSEKVAGILGAIVAAVVLVIAIAFGPIGQMGKPAKPVKVEQPAQAVEQPAQAVPAPAVKGAGGARGAAVSLTRRADRDPLAKPLDRPYLAPNGDVDAS
jgi:hypothetical protein